MSAIEWTDKVWNPIRGCSIVSKGCKNCYAMKQAHRFSGPGGPYEGLTRLTNGGPVWTGDVRLVPELLDAPLRWKKPRRVFVNSMSDLFHEAVPDEFIDIVFAVMALAPQHTFQILTKRPERMRAWMYGVRGGEVDSDENALARLYDAVATCEASLPEWVNALWDIGADDPVGTTWPLPNVWLGVSVEDQAAADERIPLLLETPAAVRFVSAEPLLEAVDISRAMWPVHEWWPAQFRGPDEARAAGAVVTKRRQGLVSAYSVFLDWVIVGGESGPGARPCDVQWIRSIVEQCKAASVPVFCKQLGAQPYREGALRGNYAHQGPGDHRERQAITLNNRKGGDPSEWPADLRVREMPA